MILDLAAHLPNEVQHLGPVVKERDVHPGGVVDVLGAQRLREIVLEKNGRQAAQVNSSKTIATSSL